MLVVKKHIKDGQLALVICDKELLGKKFENDGVVLNLSAQYFQGEDMKINEIIGLLPKAATIQAVGKEAIQLLIAQKIVEPVEVKTIQKVQHVLVVRI